VNVILFAWCPSAGPYIDALPASGGALRLVVTGVRGSAAAALAPACERAGVELVRCPDVNDASFIQRIESHRPALLLVAGCSQILGRALRDAAGLGAVNLHPSLLPSYSGKEPLFWALLRGEPRVGITAHVMTDALDAGPILLQREVPVPPRATSASLAEDVDREGAALLPDLLAMARRGALLDARAPEPGASPEIPGAEPLDPRWPASHFPALRPEHGLLDWARSAVELDRLVRACAGEIHAYTFFRGMRLVLLEAEPIDAPPALSPAAAALSPGAAVLGMDRGALLVAAQQGALWTRRWLFMGRVHSGEELAASLDIRAGARLTSSPAFLE